MILQFNINNQIITRTDTEKPVQHSKNYLKAKFTFSEEWEGLTKKVQFSNGVKKVINVLDETNKCTVPKNTLTSSNLIISIEGVDYEDNIVISTDEVVIPLRNHPPSYSLYYSHYPKPHHHHWDYDDIRISHEVLDIIFKKLNTKFDKIIAEEGKIYFYSNDELIDTIDIQYASEVDPLFQSSAAFNISNEDLANIKKLEQGTFTIKQVKDYLYEFYTDDLDYKFAIEYLLNDDKLAIPSACSSIRKGDLFGRNFDWYYNEQAEFVVRTPRKNGKYASIGVSNVKGLDDEFVKSGESSELYKLVPFLVTDGINQFGVSISTNVVPMDFEPTTETVPTVEVREILNSLMIPRFVLDNFKTASECVDYLQKYVSVYISKNLQENNYEQHFIIADENNTYVIEFIDNTIEVINLNEDGSILQDKAYITNFYLHNINLNADKCVYTPSTQYDIYNAITINHITPNGSGLERYNIIANAYDNIENEDDLKTLLYDLKYTNSYTKETEEWFTEFVGTDGLNVASDPTDFESEIIKGKTIFNNRSRDETSEYFGSWQTTHSSIYNIKDKNLKLIIQEDDEELEYSFDYYYTKQEVDELLNKYTIVNNITEESTDDEIPTAKAVYDYIQSQKEDNELDYGIQITRD